MLTHTRCAPRGHADGKQWVSPHSSTRLAVVVGDRASWQSASWRVVVVAVPTGGGGSGAWLGVWLASQLVWAAVWRLTHARGSYPCVATGIRNCCGQLVWAAVWRLTHARVSYPCVATGIRNCCGQGQRQATTEETFTKQ